MVLNIVSGKGGSGKTLLCAVLAEMLGNNGNKVVVIDMDFAVRGLTALLYYYQGETYHIINNNKCGTYDYFESKDSHKENYLARNIGIAKYRSFDVIPAVQEINRIVRLKAEQNEYNYADKLSDLLRYLEFEHQYDYIIFDCRAGYDVLNEALHNIANFTICIQEEDLISEITTLNLVRQFEGLSRKPIFRLVNKSRLYVNKVNIDKRISDVTLLGHIPFDMDVLDNFGKSYFWSKMEQTLYYSAIADIWNTFALKVNIPERVRVHRFSPIPFEHMERKLGMYSSFKRVIIVFTLITGVFGILLGIFGFQELSKFMSNNVEQTISFIVGLICLLVAILFMIIPTSTPNKYVS